MDSVDTTPRNPSIPADVEPVSDERGLHLPFEEREPGLVDYRPDLGGARQGDDVTHSVPQPLDDEADDDVTR